VLVPAIAAVVAATLVVLFIGITVGLRQAHPTDLALQPPTLLAVLARRVVGLYVRKDVSQRQTASNADWGSADYEPTSEAVDDLLGRAADPFAIRLRRLVAARSGPHAHEDRRAHAEQKPAS
jgi:hypothetical protein